MPAADRSETEVRREIELERAELARTIERLKDQGGPTAQLRERLPVVLGGALAAGFVLGGGIGATMRLLMRRGREGREQARIGRFSVADRS